MLISPSAFSQNAAKSIDNNYTRLEGLRWSLDKYLWSNARLKIEGHDKPIVDFNAIDSWRRLGEYLSISSNGRHFAYNSERIYKHLDPKRKEDSLIVQSINSSWRKGFVGVKPGFFTSDSRQYIFQEGTRLGFLTLNGGPARYVKDIASYKTPSKDNNEWLAYRLKAGESEVVLKNLVTGREKHFSDMSDYSFDYKSEWLVCQSNSNLNGNESKDLLLYQLATGVEIRFSHVADYLFSENGKALLLKIEKKVGKELVTDLEYVILPEGRGRVIWSNKDSFISLNDYSMDSPGKQVVFSIRDSSGVAKGNLASNSVWYYKKGMDKATLKLTDEIAGANKDLQIEGSPFFTDNGGYIRFSMQPRPFPSKAHFDPILPQVWNYKDLILQSAQSDLLKGPRAHVFIFNVEKGKVIQLEGENETLHLLKGNFAIVKRLSKETFGDRFWEKGYGRDRDSNWLVALSDGSRRLLKSRSGNATEIGPFWFSPSGNYLVYFDFGKDCGYFSYNLRTEKLTDISARDNNSQLSYINPYLRADRKSEQSLGLAAWLKNDAAVLVYDNNDIWQFDLQGRKAPVNLTNGFGKSNDIVFSLFNGQRFEDEIPVLDDREHLLLRAFNRRNKYNGFYRKVVGVAGDPELLYMGGCFMDLISWCQDPNLSNRGMHPIKARDVNVWVLQRQSGAEAPNYYKTADFRSFERMTNFQPQKEYSWLSEELHSFEHLGGTEGQGILYKPENFDSGKKYPVLIVFYGGYSNNLYQFPEPAYSKSAITPGQAPIWFLSNGYLIFTPDVYVAPLKYGPEAFNVIEGAARYLKQLSYVDGNKIGCCSHSWSAKLGAYMFTHSKSFSCMVISEGFLYGNMINAALTLSEDESGESKLETVEEGFQFGSLWENRDSWLDQTTVLNANNASSPLLLLCNEKSTKEYQDQTLQLFTALRRLEKKCWWLKYSKGAHTLAPDLDEQKDFTIRSTQFFDHYLKNGPAAHWMTEGIPANLRGFEAGYELDPVGSCGRGCSICEKWNEQYRKHPEMFAKPIGEWHLN